MKQTSVSYVISHLLVLLFAYTAFSKFFSRSRFEGILWQIPFIGHAAPVLSFGIPVLEVLLAALLLSSKHRLTGLYASFGTLLLFTLYLALILSIRADLPCRCGGVIGSMSWPQHVLFNCLFLGLTGWAIQQEVLKKNLSQRQAKIFMHEPGDAENL